MHAHETLNGAADLIERDGWCQHSYVEPNGARCAAEAISEVVYGQKSAEVAYGQKSQDGQDGSRAWWAAVRAFSRYLGLKRYIGIECWNDAKGRTAEEVVEAMRAAALVAEAQLAQVNA